MARLFELWDGASRNLIGAYESEADALAFVHAYVTEHGPAYPSSWVLLWDDDAADEAGQVAEGAMLVARAEATTPREPSSRTSRRLAG